MDDVDRRIVSLLRANGRASYAELARTVGLSAPSVHERVSKLESSGVILGYHAAVDRAAVGEAVTALVGVFESDVESDEDLVEALRQMSEITDCFYVAGEEAFLLRVRVADIAALERIVSAISRLRGVSRTRTTVVLSSRWEDRNA
ncbi:MAG: Lrp/AsnC family transcriptional regulator [Actinomycetota bacterium]|nr:Lrp/AsnC family transcriptional regulator [Actinomycetota bacterium]